MVTNNPKTNMYDVFMFYNSRNIQSNIQDMNTGADEVIHNEFDQGLYLDKIFGSVSLKTLPTQNKMTNENDDDLNMLHTCVCDCSCSKRSGFNTLAPYRIGHSLIRKKIHVCQHFASCKYSGKTCRDV